MRGRTVVAAFAVPAILVGAIGLAVEGGNGFLRHPSSNAVESAAAVAGPGGTAPARRAADGAAANASAPRAARAPAPAAAPARSASTAASTVGVSPREFAGYQRQIVAAVDGWWISALRGAGVSYRGPRLVVAAAGRRASSHCGRQVANPAEVPRAYPAFYCRGDRTVYLSAGWLYRSIYSNFHRGGVAAIVAHEFGHHVQHSIGIADPKVSRQELQADCLAGVWMRSAAASGRLTAKDVEDGRRALRALGDTKVSSRLHHGTPAERTRWFDRGYASGDAYRCNHF